MRSRQTSQPQPSSDQGVPDFDQGGIMVPPWVKYPHIPFGSIGWRMGDGENYRYRFGEWWLSQNEDIRIQSKIAYPEPDEWPCFYAVLEQDLHLRMTRKGNLP